MRILPMGGLLHTNRSRERPGRVRTIGSALPVSSTPFSHHPAEAKRFESYVESDVATLSPRRSDFDSQQLELRFTSIRTPQEQLYTPVCYRALLYHSAVSEID